MTRLSAEWKNYCVYSGTYLPDTALNDEHIIPKGLGGYKCASIRASHKLNSDFGTRIDKKVMDDDLIKYGRRDANAKGHSRKQPVARIEDTQFWKPGDNMDLRKKGTYNLDFHKDGPLQIYNKKTGAREPPSDWPQGGFIKSNMNIDHDARALFTLKTLLGFGWKLFGPQFLDAVDVAFMRAALSAQVGVRVSNEGREGGIAFLDPILVQREYREHHFLASLDPLVVKDKLSTVLLRESDGLLEFTVGCLGYLVGNVRLPLKGRLMPDEHPGSGLRLVVTRNRLRREIIPAPDLAPIERIPDPPAWSVSGPETSQR